MATTALQQEKNRFRAFLLKEKQEIDSLLSALDRHGASRPGRKNNGGAMGDGPLEDAVHNIRAIGDVEPSKRPVGKAAAAGGHITQNLLDYESMTLAEAARKILAKGPLTTNDLLNALLMKGKTVGGARPVATVYSTLIKSQGITRKDGKWHAVNAKPTLTRKRKP